MPKYLITASYSAEGLRGLHPEATGSIFLESKLLDRLDTSDRMAAGLAMVPEDRQVSGLVQSLSVLANMTVSSLGQQDQRYGGAEVCHNDSSLFRSSLS